MCNINIIVDKKNEGSSKLNGLMNTITYLSYLKNSDGEGYIFLKEGKITTDKHKDKINYFSNKHRKIMVTHQRLSTSGHSESNTHPHETKDLIIVHNGIFSDLGTAKESDTKQFSDIMQREYNKNNKDIVKTIQYVMKELISGSYSIVVYDKNTKKFYYFKEMYTDMYLIETKEYLIMSTLQENVEYAKWFLGLKGIIRTPKELIVYDITENLKRIGKFKEKVRVYEYQNENWSWNNKKSNKRELTDFVKYETEADLVSIAKDKVYIGIDNTNLTTFEDLFGMDNAEIKRKTKNKTYLCIDLEHAEAIRDMVLEVDTSDYNRGYNKSKKDERIVSC